MAKRSRHFFLNERHELPHQERDSGGSLPKLAPIAWAERGASLSRSLGAVRDHLRDSNDPLRHSRFFFLAQPQDSIQKESIDAKKAPDGTFAEPVDFSGDHNFTFTRLGLDLVNSHDDGSAVVHATPSEFEQLEQLTRRLWALGKREQARWVAVSGFEVARASYRVDEAGQT